MPSDEAGFQGSHHAERDDYTKVTKHHKPSGTSQNVSFLATRSISVPSPLVSDMQLNREEAMVSSERTVSLFTLYYL